MRRVVVAAESGMHVEAAAANIGFKHRCYSHVLQHVARHHHWHPSWVGRPDCMPAVLAQQRSITPSLPQPSHQPLPLSVASPCHAPPPPPPSPPPPPHTTSPAGTKRGRPPVWVDPADAAVSVPVAAVSRLRKLRQYKGQTDMSGQQYEEALRRQHTILNPRTNWAAGSSSKSSSKVSTKTAAAGAAADYVIDDEAEPDESAAQQLLLSGSGLLLGGGAAAGGLLAPGLIEMSRLRDANGSSPSQAVVQALQFHPNGQLMLTAGFDKRLKLFQVRDCMCVGLCVGGGLDDCLCVTGGV